MSSEEWAAAGPVVKQAAVGAALQTIDAYARAAAAAGGFDRAEAQLSRTNLRLDAKGWNQAAKACEKLLAELRRIEENAAKRLGKDPEGGSDAALAILLFDAVAADGDTPDGRQAPRRAAQEGTQVPPGRRRRDATEQRLVRPARRRSAPGGPAAAARAALRRRRAQLRDAADRPDRQPHGGRARREPEHDVPAAARARGTGLITGDWEHPGRRTRRFYSITAAGEAEPRGWRGELGPRLDRITRAIAHIRAEALG